MPRYLVQVQDIKIQRIIVVAANNSEAIEYARNKCNVRALSYPKQIKNVRILQQLEKKDRFEELREEQEINNSIII